MGLLDDAIREHLDLKRRRGADPAEIERAEREALGPVRRESVKAAFPEEDPHGSPPDLALTRSWEDAKGGELRAHRRRGLLNRFSSGKERNAGRAPRVEQGESFAGYGPEPPHSPSDIEAAQMYDEPAGAPIEEWRPTDEPEGDGVLHETAEYDVAGAFSGPAAEPAAEDPAATDAEEDVLEETPEFLQDTPDHDRLWFEQRPPRDFDFDG